MANSAHAVRKDAILTPDAVPVDGLHAEENISVRTPTSEQRALGDKVLTKIPAASPLLYARIDLLPAPSGHPMVLEVELTEPSLFLAYADHAFREFAQAIARRLP